jgi:hypothetical protein
VATFIKNNCDCCQPAVCDECGSSSCITTSKQFLPPGSTPQSGVIIANSFTLQLADLEFCPCGNFDCGTCPNDCGPFCSMCESNQSSVISSIYSPITLAYYSSSNGDNPNPGDAPGYYGPSPYFSDPFAAVYASNPNTIFVPASIEVVKAFYDYSSIYFQAGCLISETSSSLTFRGSFDSAPCFSGIGVANAQRGTATLTWS